MNGHSDVDSKDREKDENSDAPPECDDVPKTSVTTTTMKKGDYEDRSERVAENDMRSENENMKENDAS